MTDDTTPTPEPTLEPTPEPTPAAPAEEARSESVSPAADSDAPAASHEPAPDAEAPPVPASPEVVPEAPEHAPAAAASPAEVAAVETPATTDAPEPEPEPVAETPVAPSEPEATATEAEAPAKPKRTRKPKAAPVPAASAAAIAVDADAGDGSDAAATTSVDPTATATAEPAAPAAPESKKKWYAVKIQSGREESIKSAIERKVKIEGLEEFFGQIVIPVEEMVVKKKVKVKNKKTGETTTQEKNVTKYNKKYPGYLFTEVEFNDQILYVFRETSGVGDFVGIPAKKKQGAWENVTPSPMTEREVQSMLTGIPDPTRRKAGQPAKTVVKLDFEKGDKVRIRNGAFVGSEGEVKSITEPRDPTETPKVTVVVTFWGRPVDVEVDYWEVDKV